MRGPNFSRVFNTPGNFYSERYKHVIGPEVTWTYPQRRRRGVPLSSPKFDGHDYIVATNEVRYSLVQRFYAKRPRRAAASWSRTSSSTGASRRPTTWTELASEFDPNYSNLRSAARRRAGATSRRCSSRMRFRPDAPAPPPTSTLQYDMKLHDSSATSDLSAGARTTRGSASTPAGRAANRQWRRTRRAGRTHVRHHPQRGALVPAAGPAGGGRPGGLRLARQEAHADQRARPLRRAVLRLHGASGIHSDYGPARQERQFRFSIELANIGSIGNFMGQTRRQRLPGMR